MSSKKSATFNMRMEPQKKKQMEEFFQEFFDNFGGFGGFGR